MQKETSKGLDSFGIKYLIRFHVFFFYGCPDEITCFVQRKILILSKQLTILVETLLASLYGKIRKKKIYDRSKVTKRQPQ